MVFYVFYLARGTYNKLFATLQHLYSLLAVSSGHVLYFYHVTHFRDFYKYIGIFFGYLV